MFQILFTFLIEPIWKYIKKSILGNKSVKEAMKTEKKRLVFFFLVTFSVMTNVFLIPRIIALSKDYVEEHKEAVNLREENIGLKAIIKDTQTQLANKTCPVVTPPTCPAVPVKKHHGIVIDE